MKTPPATKSPIKFQYGPSKKNGQFYWRIRARNGEIIADGEGYRSKRGPIHVFNLLRRAFGAFDFEVPIVELDRSGRPRRKLSK